MSQNDRPRTCEWTQLAMRVACGATEAERNSAMQQLLPEIIKRAGQVGVTFRPQVRADLMSEAGLLVWQKLRSGLFQPTGEDCFSGWCATLLRNRAIDLNRRTKRQRTLPAVLVENQSDPSDSEQERARQSADRFARRLTELRKVLDQIAWGPQRAGQVDYFAVLLVTLRLKVAARVGATFAEAPPPGDVAELADRCVPWRDAEAGRRF